MDLTGLGIWGMAKPARKLGRGPGIVGHGIGIGSKVKASGARPRNLGLGIGFKA